MRARGDGEVSDIGAPSRGAHLWAGPAGPRVAADSDSHTLPSPGHGSSRSSHWRAEGNRCACWSPGHGTPVRWRCTAGPISQMPEPVSQGYTVSGIIWGRTQLPVPFLLLFALVLVRNAPPLIMFPMEKGDFFYDCLFICLEESFMKRMWVLVHISSCCSGKEWGRPPSSSRSPKTSQVPVTIVCCGAELCCPSLMWGHFSLLFLY